MIKSNPVLCFRLLRYLNSAAFGFHNQVTSIPHALTLLGETEMRKWLMIMSTIAAGYDRPQLVELALVRGCFGEQVAPLFSVCPSQMFLLGLMSLMDSILELPLSVISQELALSSELRAALTGDYGSLRECLDLVLAYERGDWDFCRHQLSRLHAATNLPDLYLKALRWTRFLIG